MSVQRGNIFDTRFWPSFYKWVSLVLCFLVVFLGRPALASEVSLEYKIKAAYTFNFIKFIDWSKQVHPGSGSEFVISIIGQGPINAALAELENKPVSGKPLKIRFVDHFKEAGPSNIYFINASAEDDLGIITQKARQAGILTVGEMDEFCEKGGIINFIIMDDSIQFEINQKEAQRANLSISYKLLKQASRVIR